jgi:SAM-dependent methyltransferase
VSELPEEGGTDWDRLFDEIYVRTYGATGRGGDAEAQASAVVALLGCRAPADVLDCPCGYGRHAIPLARSGYRVVGADRSPALLEEARKAAPEGDWPRWVQADHRSLPYEQASFDVVLNLFSSLGYRGEEGDRRTLSEFRRVLRPGGALVVETMHRDLLASNFRPRGWDPLPNGGMLVEERRFDVLEGEIETKLTLVEPDGGRDSLRYRLRVYTATELARLVREAGFDDVQAYGDYEGAPLSIDTRLVLVAR